MEALRTVLDKIYLSTSSQVSTLEPSPHLKAETHMYTLTFIKQLPHSSPSLEGES